MEEAPWEECRLSLASHLVDSAPPLLASQPANAGEKIRALKPAEGLQRNREAIRAVRPRRPAILFQRATRLPSTRELAASLRNRTYQIRHSPLPAEVEVAEDWLALA